MHCTLEALRYTQFVYLKKAEMHSFYAEESQKYTACVFENGRNAQFVQVNLRNTQLLYLRIAALHSFYTRESQEILRLCI